MQLRREARWAGLCALAAAPLVLAMLAGPLPPRENLRPITGTLGVVEHSSRWIQFVLDEEPPPIRYSARLGRMQPLLRALLESEGEIHCLVDERAHLWELSVDGKLFVSYEYAEARMRAQRTIGWLLSGILLLSGGGLCWYALRPAPAPTDG